MIICVLWLAAGCGSGGNRTKDIGYSELPEPAKTFINTSYVAIQERSNSSGIQGYAIRYAGGYAIYFDKGGNWRSVVAVDSDQTLPVDIFRTSSPMSVIGAYLISNYSDPKIVGVEKKFDGGYQVELRSGEELTFNSEGDFVIKVKKKRLPMRSASFFAIYSN